MNSTIIRKSVHNGTFPIRRNQFDLPRFAAWLAMQGAEIGVPTNAYEVIRYKAYVVGGRKAVTHIVYTKENGLLTFMGGSRAHYEQMLGVGASPATAPVPTPAPAPTPVKLKASPEPASLSARQRKRLLERDGDECWFCGKPLAGDATIEHLVPKSKRGGNVLDNFALAHRRCNNSAGDMPLVKKIELRNRLRLALSPEGNPHG